jgi:hypothetical protein
LAQKHGGATDDKKKVCQQFKLQRNVMPAHRQKQKAVKALLNDKMAAVRIGAKVEKFHEHSPATEATKQKRTQARS